MLNVKRYSLTANRVIFLLLGFFLVPNVHAEIEVKPKIDLTLLHIVTATVADNSYDGHQVGTFNPALSVLRKGRVWESRFDYDYTFVDQYQSGYDDTSFTNASLNNKLSFWQDQLSISNTINRQNRNIDTSLGSTADPIYGRSEFIDVDNISTRLSLNNSPRSAWRNAVSLSQSETKFDESQLVETDSTVTNLTQGTNQTARLSVAYGQRAKQIRGGLHYSFSRKDRVNRSEQDTVNLSGNLGIPLGSSIDLVVQGNKNKNMIENSVLENSDLESESYGAGLAWRFGNRSNIEMTYNKNSLGEDDDFVGYKLDLYPSERSRLVYEQSQRFYGESHSFDLSHTAKRWQLSVNYGENLASQTRIERSDIDLGTFLCPDDFTGVEDCSLLVELPDVIEEGTFVAGFTEPVFSLEEETVLSKSATVNFSYSFKKAKLSFTYGLNDTEFLEREGVRTSVNKTMTFTHNMTRRNSLRISASDSLSEQTYGEASAFAEDRESYSVNMSFIRKMSRKATGKISLVKYSSQSTIGNLDRTDTRIEMNYSYAF